MKTSFFAIFVIDPHHNPSPKIILHRYYTDIQCSNPTSASKSWTFNFRPVILLTRQFDLGLGFLILAKIS